MGEASDSQGAAQDAIQAPALSTPAALDELQLAVNRGRHDLNNLLMAALAEVQLLMLDKTTPETRQSYEFIQEQLRAMRDIIATMSDPRN